MNTNSIGEIKTELENLIEHVNSSIYELKGKIPLVFYETLKIQIDNAVIIYGNRILNISIKQKNELDTLRSAYYKEVTEHSKTKTPLLLFLRKEDKERIYNI